MAKENTQAGNATEQGVLISRIFNAPVNLVWKAWIDPKHMVGWWGPKDFSCPVAKIDLRVGGKYLLCMRSAEGQELWTTGTYQEIIPMKKITYTDSFADKDGKVVPASTYGMEGIPDEMQVTLTFEDIGGKTKFTLRHVGLPAGQMTEMTIAGWNESLDKLASTLH